MKALTLFALVCLISIQLTVVAADDGWNTAGWTYYDLYPACCPQLPNYDPNADTDECDHYDGCVWYAPGQVSWDDINRIKYSNNVAFYDDSDPDGNNFQRNWSGKQIRVRANGVEFIVNIDDTCGNGDGDVGDNVCSQNSRGGYLIDMEYFTVMNNFGNTDIVSGTIEWQLI